MEVVDTAVNTKTFDLNPEHLLAALGGRDVLKVKGEVDGRPVLLNLDFARYVGQDGKPVR